MENTEEKKQETINPNYKRKTQEPKLESFVFESTLYTVSFGIFFFTSYFPSYNLPSMSVFIDVLCMSS